MNDGGMAQSPPEWPPPLGNKVQSPSELENGIGSEDSFPTFVHTCLLEIGHDSWVRRKIENAKVQTFLPFTGSAHLTFSHAPIMQFFERTTSSTPEWTRNHQKTQPFYPKTSWGLKTMSYNWLAERSSNFKGDAARWWEQLTKNETKQINSPCLETMSIEWQVRWSTWPTNWPNNEAPNYPVTWFAFEQRPIKKCLCDIWEDFWVLIHISKYLPSEMGDKDSEPSVEKCPLVRFIDAFSSSFFALRQIFEKFYRVLDLETRREGYFECSSAVKFSFDQGLKSPPAWHQQCLSYLLLCRIIC